MSGLGRSLIIVGLILIAAGLLIAFVPALITRISALTNLFSATTAQKITSNLLRLPALFGRLPGDIAIKRGNFSFYFPLATCLLLSAIISFIIWLLRK